MSLGRSHVQSNSMHSLSTVNTWGFLVNKLNPECSRFEVGFQWRVSQQEESPVEIALQPSACLELHLLQAGL